MRSLNNLRVRLALLLVLAFAPILALTVYGAYLAQDRRLAEIEASELSLARQVATTLGQVIQRAHEVLRVLTHTPVVQRLDGPACSALVAKLVKTMSHPYANLSVARTNGDVFCSGLPLVGPVNVARTPTFARAIERRGFAVGDYLVSLISGRPILGTALPVLDERGEIVAVAGALISLDWLNQLAARTALPAGGTLTVIDRSGTVVVRHPGPEKWIGKAVVDEPLFAALARGETRFDAGLGETRHRFTFAKVEGIPAPAALYVGTGIDPESELTPIRAALHRDLGILLCVAFLAFALAWFGTERTVTRRVNELLTATHRVAAGNLTARTGASGGPTELRQLARAFDDMASALQRREEEMNEGRARLAEQQAQLRQAQKMDALGTLAGGIAHDFNNILGAILCNVAMAREDLDPNHPAQESLGEIGKASERARDLVRQILTFSRHQAHERRVLQLSDVVQESVKLLRATLPAGIELIATCAPHTPNVMGDRSQIHQVLMNLCTNAWHAIDGPQGRIEIALAGMTVAEDTIGVGLPPGHYARLTVTDTGKGMDAATLERIFDPFFTTKASGEGTGLGLAVVDGIVKNHDGATTVDSVPGRGTSFHLHFPAVVAETEAAGHEDEPRTPARGRGQRILYVDDEAPLVRVATRLLQRLGYEPRGFTRPADALVAFEADPTAFDLLIVDFNMPAISGLEVASRALRLRPNLPVALASGFFTEELRARAAALGIREVIFKPSTAEAMSQAIGRMLDDTA